MGYGKEAGIVKRIGKSVGIMDFLWFLDFEFCVEVFVVFEF